MMVLLALLSIACIIMLFVGLIKPSAVLFSLTKTSRGKVLLIYGLGAIFFLVMMGLISPDKPMPAEKEFTGLLIFETNITGDSSATKDLAIAGIPTKTIIEIGKNCFRCTEDGGFTNGTFFKDTAKYKSWFLNHEDKTAIYGTCSDIDENATDLLKQMYPYTYGTELKATDDTLSVCGHKTIKYKIIHSSFVRDNAQAFAWITADYKFPLHRYDFQTKSKRMVSPLPLSLINEKGMILKAEVTEWGVTVTYFATRVEAKDFEPFRVPDDYQIISDPI